MVKLEKFQTQYYPVCNHFLQQITWSFLMLTSSVLIPGRQEAQNLRFRNGLLKTNTKVTNRHSVCKGKWACVSVYSEAFSQRPNITVACPSSPFRPKHSDTSLCPIWNTWSQLTDRCQALWWPFRMCPSIVPMPSTMPMPRYWLLQCGSQQEADPSHASPSSLLQFNNGTCLNSKQEIFGRERKLSINNETF